MSDRKHEDGWWHVEDEGRDLTWFEVACILGPGALAWTLALIAVIAAAVWGH